jgi:Gamma-glutamyl cyclotransferase, AIG2-like
MQGNNSQLVFQYGSNMSVARMQESTERIPEARPVEAAWTVERYDFRFPIRSKKYNRAVSGIVPNASGRKIYGALYEIPYDLIDRAVVRPGRRSLDQIEGAGKRGNYYRTTIAVVGVESNKSIEVITYLPNSQDNPGFTDDEYAAHILEGLAQWNAPLEYIEYVKEIIARALPT